MRIQDQLTKYYSTVDCLVQIFFCVLGVVNRKLVDYFPSTTEPLRCA